MMTFPSTRPIVRITRSKSHIQSVDCPELQWWFVVPRKNEDYAFAYYDTETQSLDCVASLSSSEAESSNQRNVVRIDVDYAWRTEKERAVFSPRMQFLASLDSSNASFLSVANLSRDGRVIDETAQEDSSFEQQWGTRGRCLENNGRFEQQHDGSLCTTASNDLGEGTYDVTIGKNSFECLRVLDYDSSEPFGGELAEAYIERRSGRTVYYREFSGRFYRQSRVRGGQACAGVDILEMHPNNTRIVIDGELYIQCGCTMRGHDVITLAGLGGLNPNT